MDLDSIIPCTGINQSKVVSDLSFRLDSKKRIDSMYVRYCVFYSINRRKYTSSNSVLVQVWGPLTTKGENKKVLKMKPYSGTTSKDL